MSYREPFGIDEWYHCYNRGVDKRKVFQSKKDYERFVMLMYLGNSARPIHVSNLKGKQLRDLPRDLNAQPLVEIGCYALMPNHFHFLLREIRQGGIASFMQKMFTGYTMYFNKKYERTGSLFAGPFKSKHVPADNYFKNVVSYIHLNPVGLFEPLWKEGAGNVTKMAATLDTYSYSSLFDFVGGKRPENILLGTSIFGLFDHIPSTKEMLEDALEYCAEVSRRGLDTNSRTVLD